MKKTVLLILLFNIFIKSQQISNWQNYTNLQMINDVLYSEQTIWCATDGGVFGYYIPNDTYQILTKSEGLSSHSTTSIAVDNNNKVWIGTSEGFIDVYDPATGTVNTIYDITKESENNKKINDIQISNDTAFVSTEFGLILFNTNDNSVYDGILKFGDFAARTAVKNILHGKTIYVVTQAGIASNKLNFSNLSAPEAWETLPITNISEFNIINDIVIYLSILHVATNDGVFKFENGNWSQIILDNINVTDLYVKDGSLYSIANNFVFKYDQIDNNSIFTLNNTLFNKLTTINDDILIASNEGVIKYSPSSTAYILPNSPQTNSIQNMTVDFEGNLWAGTGKDGNGIGVLKFDGISWTTIDRATISAFLTNDYHKVSSSDNAVYLISWGFGFVKYSGDSFQIYDAASTGMVGIPGSNSFLVINDVKEDLGGNAWILNYWAADGKPLSVLTKDGEIYSYQLTPSIINVENLVIDQYGTKWFTGDYGGDVATDGLYYYNENGTFEKTSDDVFGKITESTGLRNRDVKALALDEFGELIIGTSVGVDVISNTSSFSSIRGDQYFALRQQTINAIVVDPINQKWFGTEKGVFLMNSDGSSLLANFTKDNSPLPSDNIKSLAIDKNNGIVYVGTEFGITAISTLFIQPNKDFSDLYVYPNPVVISSNADANIVIDGLVEDSKVSIIDISGKLIHQFRSIGGKTTNWDCKNSDGQLVASGIYIAVAYDEEVNEIGHAKFAVLRK